MTQRSKPLVTIRHELPALERVAYLNTGSVGLLPRRTAQAIAAENERQLSEGRSNFKRFLEDYIQLLEGLRARVARLLGADADEIALTHHTTDGVNIAVWGLNWRPGDEIVTTTGEHEGGFMPVYAAARRFDLRLRVVDVGSGSEVTSREAADRVIAALSPRTRLAVVSHVMWRTGAVLPLAEIAAAAHRVGALVAVDGAQSAGALPVDVRHLGVDFYTVSGQKWLCGPEGTGALYVRRERLSELALTFAGYFSLSTYPAADHTGYFIPAPGARRFETSSVYWPALYGLNESLRWLEEEAGYDWIFERRRAITQRCREMLAELPGVTVHSPPDDSGLTTFSMAGLEPVAASNALADMGIIIRSLHDPERLRVSTAFFNNDDDLARLREGLFALRALRAKVT
ncbi:MAG: aminotransferase class V-fold PLP-dependent enzyme [Anaerolineales bacterium]